MIAASPVSALRVRSWRMPPMAAADLPWRNALLQFREPWQWQWDGRLCSVGLVPPAAPPAGPVWQLVLDWEGDTLRLAITDPQQLLAVLWPADPWPGDIDWPPALWQALHDTLLAGWRQTHPSLRPARVRVVSVRHEVLPPAHTLVGWTLAADGEQVTGLLAMDAGAAARLAGQCRQRPVRPTGDWSDLPVPLRLQAGWTDLSLHELARTGAGDVLLMDVCHLGTDRQALVFLVGEGLGVRARRHAQGWLIDQGVHSVMTLTHAPSEPPTGEAAHLDDIPVRVTFDLGDREMTLGELRALMPGYVFNLGRDPQAGVVIRVNGRWVGEGELVDIDGRIGVVVHRLQGVERP